MQINLCKHFDTRLNYAVSNTDILNKVDVEKISRLKLMMVPAFVSCIWSRCFSFRRHNNFVSPRNNAQQGV
jgi:hypothetical protein